MKRIILREDQYKRLIKKNLNEQKIVFSNPKDEFDITNQMMQLLIHLEFFIDSIANKFLYIDKVENGIIYIDSAKYTKEEKDLINTEIDKWIVFTDSTRDKRSQDLTYNFGVDSDWDDRYPNEDIAVVDNDNNSATDDIDLDDNSTAEVEEEIDVSDIEACKWGKNASGKDRKVILPTKEDIQFYKDVLKGIGANVTCEKMLFFFAWRSGESSDSSFNPFATTYADEDNECCYYNCLKNGVGYKPIACRTCPEGTSPGVRNYLNKKAGVNATINTIKARYYPNLLRRLRNDNSTAMDLASETKELSVWGTGSLPKQILEKNSTVNPKKIKDYNEECSESTVVKTDCELTTEEVKFYNKYIRNDEDNLDFRYWVNQDSERIKKVNKKLADCGLSDPKLDKNGSKNEYLEIAFALIGKDWVKAGKPKRPDEEEEEVVVDDVIYDSSELLTWSKNAKKDRDAGIINPTLISDIIKALKSINMRAQISWARTGHSKYTNNGNISRHWSGNAVDISVIEGVGNSRGKSSNKGIGNANFMKNGDRLVNELKKLGYSFGESNIKAYLWRTNTGGNHWNHVHVSNKDRKKKVETEIPKKVVKTDCELTTEEVEFYNKHIKNDQDNLDFRYWVNQDSNRLTKVKIKLADCGLSDPDLDKNGSKNQYLEIAFALIGKDWVKAGKPKRPDEEVKVEKDNDNGKRDWKKNGRLDLSELTQIMNDKNGTKEYLSKAAATQFNKMVVDAKEKGVKITLSDAYRICGSPNGKEKGFTQWKAYKIYKAGGNVAAEPYPNTAEKWNKLPVYPNDGCGYCTSNHGFGNAIDVADGKKWIRDNGKKYGWYWGEAKSESWHFTFCGEGVVNTPRFCSGKIKVETEIPKKSEEPKKSETKGNELPPNVQKLMDKLKTDWGVNITQSHIDKEYQMEGDVRPDAGRVNEVALTQITKLISDCKKANPTVNFPNTIKHGVSGLVSGYRSYDYQVKNFGTKVRDKGRTIENVQASNCLPGFTQHHTGKAFDIFSTETDWWDKNPNVKKWVADNCKKYGFKVTYTKPNQLRIPEPWHLFYIG